MAGVTARFFKTAVYPAKCLTVIVVQADAPGSEPLLDQQFSALLDHIHHKRLKVSRFPPQRRSVGPNGKVLDSVICVGQRGV